MPNTGVVMLILCMRIWSSNALTIEHLFITTHLPLQFLCVISLCWAPSHTSQIKRFLSFSGTYMTARIQNENAQNTSSLGARSRFYTRTGKLKQTVTLQWRASVLFLDSLLIFLACFISLMCAPAAYRNRVIHTCPRDQSCVRIYLFVSWLFDVGCASLHWQYTCFLTSFGLRFAAEILVNDNLLVLWLYLCVDKLLRSFAILLSELQCMCRIRWYESACFLLIHFETLSAFEI